MKTTYKNKVYIENIELLERDNMSNEQDSPQQKDHKRNSSLKSGTEKKQRRSVTWSPSSKFSTFEITEDEKKHRAYKPTEQLDSEWKEYKIKQDTESQSPISTDETTQSDATSVTDPIEVDTFKSSFKEKIFNQELVRKIKNAEFDEDFQGLVSQGANPNYVEEADSQKGIEESRSLLSIAVDEYAKRRTGLMQLDETTQGAEIKKAQKELGNLRQISSSLMEAYTEYPQLSKADPTLKISESSSSPLQRSKEKIEEENSLTQLLQKGADRLLIEIIAPNNSRAHPDLINSAKAKANLDGGGNPNITFQDANGSVDSILNVALKTLAKSSSKNKTEQVNAATRTIGYLIEKGADIYESPYSGVKSGLDTAESYFGMDDQFVQFMIDTQAQREGYVRERPKTVTSQFQKLWNDRLYDAIFPPASDYPPIVRTNQMQAALNGGASPNSTFTHSENGKQEPILNLALEIHEAAININDTERIDASRTSIAKLISNGADIYAKPSQDIMSPLEKALDLFGESSPLVSSMIETHQLASQRIQQIQQQMSQTQVDSLSSNDQQQTNSPDDYLNTFVQNASQRRRPPRRVSSTASDDSHASRTGMRNQNIEDLRDSNRRDRDRGEECDIGCRIL